EVVAARMAGDRVLRLAALGYRLLHDAGQRVELGEDADHRSAAAVLRDERGRHAGDARLDLETRRTELCLQQRAAFVLLKAHLGKLPDPLRDLGVVAVLRVDRRERRL